jgi:hypothetical protein
MKSDHRHVRCGANDPSAPAGANHMDNVRVVEKDEPLVNMDGDRIPRKVVTDHANGTGRKGLRGRAERWYQQAG